MIQISHRRNGRLGSQGDRAQDEGFYAFPVGDISDHLQKVQNFQVSDDADLAMMHPIGNAYAYGGKQNRYQSPQGCGG